MSAALRTTRKLGGAFALAAVLLATAPQLACKPAAPKAAPPAGTVLLLNGTPIRAAEVEEICGWFALLEPLDSALQLRRLALTNVVFPKLAAQGIDPSARAHALERAKEWRAAVLAGTLPKGPLSGPMQQEKTGYMRDLGFAVWNACLSLPPEQWSEVLETPGCFHLVQVHTREPGETPAYDKFTLSLFDFPYLDGNEIAQQINTQIDRAHLEFVDESWRDAVPAAWQYRMRGGNP